MSTTSLTELTDTNRTLPQEPLDDVFVGEYNETDLPPGRLAIGHYTSPSVKKDSSLAGKFLLDDQGICEKCGSIRVYVAQIDQRYEEDCEFGKGLTGGRLFDSIAEMKKAGIASCPIAFISLIVERDLGEFDLPSGPSVSRATWIVRKTAYPRMMKPLREWSKDQRRSDTGEKLSQQVVTLSLSETTGTNSYFVPTVDRIEPAAKEDLEVLEDLSASSG